MMRWFVVAAMACGGDQPAAMLPDASAPMAVNEALIGVAESSVGGNDMTIEQAQFTTTTYAIATVELGPCRVDDRTMTGPPVTSDGGTVTISGGAAAPVVMTPDAQNGYFAQMTGLTYAAGDTLTMSSTGTPAISGTLVFPARIAMTSAVPSSITKAGFTATWTPIATPVHIVISTQAGASRTVTVDCTFDGNAGTGTVPGAAVADLLPGSGLLDVTGEVRQVSTVGDYAVTLLAVNGSTSVMVPID